MCIVDMLKVGKENAITREQLCIRLKQPDRTVRKMIAEARLEGAIIINAQDGAGYYLSDDPADCGGNITPTAAELWQYCGSRNTC